MTSPTSDIPPPPARSGLPRGVVLPDTPAAAPTVLHFSEEPDIAVFVPRSTTGNPDSEPLVWAIDDAHAPLYYFPRDCPRVAIWALPTSTQEDIDRFLGITTARMVIAIEAAWLDRMRSTTLYAYRLPADDFVLLASYGAHVSRKTVTPLAVERIDDPIGRLTSSNVELRITPSLWPFRNAAVPSTMHFSCIRMRNAAPETPGG
jgi:hypothetical protein